MNKDHRIAAEVLRLRYSQMLVNEKCKAKEFKIPVHLALGHEAIAVAVSAIMKEGDQLALSHRNIHYNLARSESLKAEIDEYLLKDEGLAGGRLGAMNLANPCKGIIYTSSILGNNLCVSAGLALGKKIKSEEGIVIVVTGDGAMEEGAFYEAVQFLKTFNLSALVIVENNGWSLATQIHERRCPIHLDKFGASLDVPYVLLDGNDAYYYISKLMEARSWVLENKSPVIVEVKLTTLGYWRMKTDDCPEGKFINYHAGAAPEVHLSKVPVLREDDNDPIFVLSKSLNIEELNRIAGNVLNRLQDEIR